MLRIKKVQGKICPNERKKGYTFISGCCSCSQWRCRRLITGSCKRTLVCSSTFARTTIILFKNRIIFNPWAALRPSIQPQGWRYNVMIFCKNKKKENFSKTNNVKNRILEVQLFHQFEGWSEHCPKYQASHLIVPFFHKTRFSM